MNYQVKVSGTIHSLDPIISPKGYARACFNNPNEVSVAAEGKKLHFICYTSHKMIGKASISDITDGILKGDDSNVEWNIELKAIN